jgi:hypothetical protein
LREKNSCQHFCTLNCRFDQLSDASSRFETTRANGRMFGMGNVFELSVGTWSEFEMVQWDGCWEVWAELKTAKFMTIGFGGSLLVCSLEAS